MPTFDRDRFVADCLAAVRSHDPVDELRTVLAIAVADRDGIERGLGRKVGSDMGLLHVSDELVLQRVIFPVGYSTGLHEHRLWTLSAVYAGAEEHDLHHVEGDLLRPIGAATRAAGEIELLAPDVAHSSTSVGDEHLGVVHVYLGDLFSTGAGEWDAPDGRRREFSDAWFERLLAALESADLMTP